jgi:superfamily II DNA helicase RecQ
MPLSALAAAPAAAPPDSESQGGAASDHPASAEALGQPCTIIYVPTRKETVAMASWLVRRGHCAAPYHAGLPRKQLKETFEQFCAGGGDTVLRCLVATLAFGMGIDKANVRQVIHYGYVQSIEALHQETGRAGRDGSPAQCMLFVNLQRPPCLLASFRREQEQDAICLEMLRKLHAYAVSRAGCRAELLLRYFGESREAGWKCGSCDLCAAGPAEAVDVSRDCAVLLAAVQQVQRLVQGSATMPPNVAYLLVGRPCKRWGAQGLPCFGAGGHRHPKFWQGLARTLLDLGLLVPLSSGARRTRRILGGTALAASGRQALEDLCRGAPVPPLMALVPSADLQAALSIAPRARGAERPCRRCGQPGHRPRECPQAGGRGAGRGPRAEQPCKRCGQPGHRPRDCLEPPRKRGRKPG